MYDSSRRFYGVLDVDSTHIDDFNTDDKEGLEHIVALLMAEVKEVTMQPLC